MRRLITLCSATVGLLYSFAAWAQIPTADSGGSAPSTSPHAATHGNYTSLLLLAVFVVAFYFLLLRPQMKRNKEQKEMLSNLSTGDEVATMGGVMGKITQVEEESVELEISKNVKVHMQKQAISSVLPKGTVKLS